MLTTSGRRLAVATAALLVVLSALHWTTPTPRLQALSDTLQVALCLVGSVLCFRAAALARSLARVFWTVFGLGSLLWAGGVALLPSDPVEWVDRVGPWNSFFAASSIAYVLACALRPDRPRGWLGVAFDVAILAVLVLHTWLYFAAAYPRSGARVPADWAAMLRDGRFALMLACAAWLVEGARAPWRRVYLGLAAAIVLLSGGSSVLHRALASGLYHPGLWDLPKTLPFLWIGLLALDRPADAAEEPGAFAPGWADLRRGTIVALLAIAFIPALEFTTSFLGAQAVLDQGADAHAQIARLRTALGLTTTTLLAVLLLSRQIHLLRWAERAQREREHALRQSEERFSKAFAASPAAMSISTLDEGRYLDVNESYVRLMGPPRQEIVGRTSLELGFFQESEQRERLVRDLRERRSVRAAPLGVRTPSGEDRDVLVSLEPIVLGVTPCLLGVVEDVTDRRRAEQALRASEERYRLLFERNLAGFFRTTPEGRILECNDALVRILGYDSREELLARAAWDLYFSRAERDAEMRLLLERRSLTSYEACLRRKDGTPVWIVENEMLVAEDAGPGPVIEGTVVDITERKRAEEDMRRLAQMKTNFLVVASHEMRTPLTILAGYHELLLGDEGALSAEQKCSLEICQRTVERLIHTFNDILATLELTGGRLPLRLAPIELRELARQVLEELAPFLERRSQRAALEAPGALPPVSADGERIHEVLSNLVENAIKFTPDRGEITVRLALEPGWHRISVEDTGIGIEAEELDSIWERFYAGANPLQHASGTYEFKARGSGLGLAIAKGYVEAHGGRIWATSGGSGRGAAFHILLPSAAGASPGAVEP